MRNILEFENAFPDVTVVVLEQNYRSTQTILDAANAVIANNLGRKPKELWTDRGDGDPIVRYHGDDEVDEAQWVTREIARLHDGGDHRWGDIAVFYRTNAQSRVLEEHLARHGVPVQGHRRHPLLRPARDQGRARLPEGRGQPGRRGVGEAGPQHPQARGGRLAASASSTPTPSSRGLSFIDALRQLGRGRRQRQGRQGHHAVPRSCSTAWPQLAADDRPAPLLEALLERSGYLDELRAERTIESEGRLENLAELVGSAQEAESIDAVPRAGQPRVRRRRDRRRRQPGRAHDHPRRQGPRVPGRVHHRPGGRRVPPPALDRRARRDGGGAPPRLRGPHPGPGAPLPHPRVEPHALRRHAVQPAQPVPRRDPRASSSRPSSSAGPAAAAAPTAAAAAAYGGGAATARAARRRAAPRAASCERAMRHGHRPGQARRRGARAARWATTWCTPPSARA